MEEKLVLLNQMAADFADMIGVKNTTLELKIEPKCKEECSDPERFGEWDGRNFNKKAATRKVEELQELGFKEIHDSSLVSERYKILKKGNISITLHYKPSKEDEVEELKQRLALLENVQ